MSSRPAPAEQPSLPRRSFLARLVALAAGGALLSRAAKRAEAATMDADPWIGEIALVPFNFPPKGWAFCNGQLLAISQNTALWSLLGTTYGGDGVTNFALPDLRGRLPIHQGPNFTIGQVGGATAVTLTAAQMPAHTHQAACSSANATTDAPTGGVPARNAAGTPSFGTTADAALGTAAIATVGGSQPHENMPPYLTMNYVIALTGLYPSQT